MKITHDRAKELFKHMMYASQKGLTKGGHLGQSAIQDKTTGKISVCSLEDMAIFGDYIEDAIKMEKEYNKLKSDVVRLFQLVEQETVSEEEILEFDNLLEKLMKIGKEETKEEEAIG